MASQPRGVVNRDDGRNPRRRDVLPRHVCFALFPSCPMGNNWSIIIPLHVAGLAIACNFTAFWLDHPTALPRRIKRVGKADDRDHLLQDHRFAKCLSVLVISPCCLLSCFPHAAWAAAEASTKGSPTARAITSRSGSAACRRMRRHGRVPRNMMRTWRNGNASASSRRHRKAMRLSRRVHRRRAHRRRPHPRRPHRPDSTRSTKARYD